LGPLTSILSRGEEAEILSIFGLLLRGAEEPDRSSWRISGLNEGAGEGFAAHAAPTGEQGGRISGFVGASEGAKEPTSVRDVR